MAVTLSSMVNIAALTQSANVAIAKHGGDITSDPFGAANLRVEQAISSTDVKLSSYSQIKSGFADIQTTSRDLSDPKKTGASADIVKAAQSFASAYNTTANAASSAINGDSKTVGALSGDARANLANNDLKSILTSGSNTADLKKIGINLKSDGTLSVDTAALQSAIQSDPNAVKDTLSTVGKLADQVSTKELATTGYVGGSVNTLSNFSKSLETQLAEQKRLAAASQDAVQATLANFSSTAASGIESYMKIFSL